MLNLPCNTFQCCKLKKLLQKVEFGPTWGNMLLQLETPKFVARQVEHAVVMRDKLNKNAARITGPLRRYVRVFWRGQVGNLRECFHSNITAVHHCSLHANNHSNGLTDNYSAATITAVTHTKSTNQKVEREQ